MSKYKFQAIMTLLLLIIVVFSCKNNGIEPNLAEYKEVEELLIERICRLDETNHLDTLIIDFLKKDTSYSYCSISNFIDGDSMKLDILCHNNQESDYNYECFNCFEICILDNDTVYVDGVLSDIDSLTIYVLRNYYIFHENGAVNDSLPYFGSVYIPKITIHVGIDSKRNFSDISIGWKKFFESIDIIMLFFEELYDNISIEKFGVRFEDLTSDKKEAIVSFRPMKVKLDFDMAYCSTIIYPSDFE